MTAYGILPVKDLHDAKQRLAPALTPGQRRGLFAAMLDDVAAALAASSLDGVLMITRDAHAERVAARHGMQLLREDDNGGQTSAVVAGASWLAERGVDTMLAIPADVPLVTAADIDVLLAAHGPAPAVTIAPAHDRLGSNAVLCSPPGLLPLRFGDNSFYPHLERARALGIEPRVEVIENLELDVDHPADLERLIEADRPTCAARWLEEAGLKTNPDVSSTSR